jgi:hypothetical protein
VLQTFLPRSTPRTEISIPIPPSGTAGEPTTPEGGARHSINSFPPQFGSVPDSLGFRCVPGFAPGRRIWSSSARFTQIGRVNRHCRRG